VKRGAVEGRQASFDKLRTNGEEQDKRISEERTAEVQASTTAHPEREAVEGRQAQDKRSSEEQRVKE